VTRRRGRADRALAPHSDPAPLAKGAKHPAGAASELECPTRPRKARVPAVDAPEVQPAQDERSERVEAPVASRVEAVHRDRNRIGQAEPAARALQDLKVLAGDVIAYAGADARPADRAADDAGGLAQARGSVSRMAASASREGDRPCPRNARSLSVTRPARSGRGAASPSSAVVRRSSRARSRPNASAARRANSGRGRISGPAAWKVPRAERSTSSTITP